MIRIRSWIFCGREITEQTTDEVITGLGLFGCESPVRRVLTGLGNRNYVAVLPEPGQELRVGTGGLMRGRQVRGRNVLHKTCDGGMRKRPQRQTSHTRQGERAPT